MATSQSEDTGREASFGVERTNKKKQGKWKRSQQVCTYCRQGKNRCDFVERFPEPCSRCVSFGSSRPCYVDPAFRRVNVRKRRGSSTEPTDTALTAGPSVPTPPDSESSSSPLVSTNAELLGCGPASASLPERPPAAAPEYTVDRTVGDVYLSAAEIDVCFESFWKYYYPFFPVFLAPFGPDEAYRKSELLFWTICGIACRPRKDHTLPRARTSELCLSIGGQIRQLIGTMFVSTFGRKGRSIYTVQALLLLCEFTIAPTSYRDEDVTWFYSGNAVQLGLSLGLHRPHFAQEFEQFAGSNVEALQERTLLWAQCFIVHQSVASTIGFPSCVSDDYVASSASLPPSASTDSITTIYPDVAKILRIQRFARRLSSIMGNSTQSKSGHTDAVVGPALISILGAELGEMEGSLQPMSPMVAIRFLEAKVQLYTYGLHDEVMRGNPVELLSCYTSSIRMLEILNGLNEVYETNSVFWPRTMHCSLVLAALCLLKLASLQNHAPQKFTVDRAVIQKHIVRVYKIIKERSLVRGDECDKIAMVLHYLSHRLASPSSSAKSQNQGKSSAMCVRARMSLGSLVFDAVFEAVDAGVQLDSACELEAAAEAQARQNAMQPPAAASQTPVTSAPLQDVNNFDLMAWLDGMSVDSLNTYGLGDLGAEWMMDFAASQVKDP